MTDLPIRMFRTRTGGLAPLTEFDRDQVEALAWHKAIEVTVRQKRSSNNARHFHAVLHRLVKAGAVPPFTKAEALRKALLLDLGIVDVVQKMSGEVIMVPSSMRFDKMDEAEFNAFKASAFQRIAEHWRLDIDAIADPRIRSAA